jgi:hypothetical protein
MRKWLWDAFAIVVVAYCFYLSTKIVLAIAATVFIGGGFLLTIFGYLAAKYSMPHPTSFWLQLWYPDSKIDGEKLSSAKLFLFRIIHRPISAERRC